MRDKAGQKYIEKKCRCGDALKGKCKKKLRITFGMGYLNFNLVEPNGMKDAHVMGREQATKLFNKLKLWLKEK